MRQANRGHYRVGLIAICVAAVFPGFVSSQGPAPAVEQEPRRFIVVGADTMVPRRLADLVMPVPADNPLTVAKAALGKRLFFDRLLSNDRSVSCSTCHETDRAFADNRPLAVGVFGR